MRCRFLHRGDVFSLPREARFVKHFFRFACNFFLSPQAATLQYATPLSLSLLPGINCASVMRFVSIPAPRTFVNIFFQFFSKLFKIPRNSLLRHPAKLAFHQCAKRRVLCPIAGKQGLLHGKQVIIRQVGIIRSSIDALPVIAIVQVAIGLYPLGPSVLIRGGFI